MALSLVNDFFSNLAHSTSCRGFLSKLLLFVKLLPEEEGVGQMLISVGSEMGSPKMLSAPLDPRVIACEVCLIIGAF